MTPIIEENVDTTANAIASEIILELIFLLFSMWIIPMIAMGGISHSQIANAQ